MQTRLLTSTLALSLVACAASGPKQPPLTPLQTAQIAISRADEARAGDYANLDMSNARARLTDARDANNRAQQGKDPQASEASRQFADEARADAELALAKAQLARVQAATFSLQQQMGLIPQAPPETMTPETETYPSAPPPDMPSTPDEVPLQPLPNNGAAA